MVSWEQGAWHWCLTDGGCWIGWADHWQTMITGALAVVAASAAAAYARGQLRAARGQLNVVVEGAADQRRRSLRAARASLPGVLSAVCNHAEAVSQALVALWPAHAQLYPDETPATHPHNIRGDIARFPDELIQPLREVVEHVDDDAVLLRIASIFREAQVLDARTRPLAQGDAIALHMLATYILESATLYARAASLFEFARGRSDTVEPVDLWPTVFGFLDGRMMPEEVFDLARQERDDGLPPGEADTQLRP